MKQDLVDRQQGSKMEYVTIPRKRRRYDTASSENEERGSSKANNEGQPEVEFDENVVRTIKQEPKEHGETSQNKTTATPVTLKQQIQRNLFQRMMETFTPKEGCNLETNNETLDKAGSGPPEPPQTLPSAPEEASQGEERAAAVGRWVAQSTSSDVRNVLRRSLRRRRGSLVNRQSVQDDRNSTSRTSFSAARRGMRRPNSKQARTNPFATAAMEGGAAQDHQATPLDLNDVFKRRFRKMLKELVAKRMQKLQHTSVYSGSVSALSRKVAILERRNKALEDQAQTLLSYIQVISKEKAEQRTQTATRGTQVTMGMILSRSGLSSRSGQTPVPVSIAPDLRRMQSHNSVEGPVIVHVSGQQVPVSPSPSQIQHPFYHVQPVRHPAMGLQPGLAQNSAQHLRTTGPQPQIQYLSTRNGCTSGMIRQPPPQHQEFILPEHLLLGHGSREKPASDGTFVRRVQVSNTMAPTTNASSFAIPSQINVPTSQDTSKRRLLERNTVIPCSNNLPGYPQKNGPTPVDSIAAVRSKHSVPQAATTPVVQNAIQQMGKKTQFLYDQSVTSPPHCTCPINVVQNRVPEPRTRQQHSGSQGVASQIQCHSTGAKYPEKQQPLVKVTDAPHMNNCSGDVTTPPYLIRSFHEMLPDSYPNVRHCDYRPESLASSRGCPARKSRLPSDIRRKESHLNGTHLNASEIKNQIPPAGCVCCPPDSPHNKTPGNQTVQYIQGDGSLPHDCQPGQRNPTCNYVPQQCNQTAHDLTPSHTVSTTKPSTPAPNFRYHQNGPEVQTESTGPWPCPRQTTPSNPEDLGTGVANATAAFQSGQPVGMLQASKPVKHLSRHPEVLTRPPLNSRHPTDHQPQTWVQEPRRGLDQVSGAQNAFYYSQNSNYYHMHPYYHQNKHATLQAHDGRARNEWQQQRHLSWQQQHQQRANVLRPPNAPSQEGQNKMYTQSLQTTRPYMQCIHQGSPHFAPGTFVPIAPKNNRGMGSTNDSRFAQPSNHVSFQQSQAKSPASPHCASQDVNNANCFHHQPQQQVGPDQFSLQHDEHLKCGNGETSIVDPVQASSQNHLGHHEQHTITSHQGSVNAMKNSSEHLKRSHGETSSVHTLQATSQNRPGQQELHTITPHQGTVHATENPSGSILDRVAMKCSHGETGTVDTLQVTSQNRPVQHEQHTTTPRQGTVHATKHSSGSILNRQTLPAQPGSHVKPSENLNEAITFPNKSSTVDLMLATPHNRPVQQERHTIPLHQGTVHATTNSSGFTLDRQEIPAQPGSAVKPPENPNEAMRSQKKSSTVDPLLAASHNRPEQEQHTIPPHQGTVYATKNSSGFILDCQKFSAQPGSAVKSSETPNEATRFPKKTSTVDPLLATPHNRPEQEQHSIPPHQATVHATASVKHQTLPVQPESDVKPSANPNEATRFPEKDPQTGLNPLQSSYCQVYPPGSEKVEQVLADTSLPESLPEPRSETSSTERKTAPAGIKPLVTVEECDSGIVLSWDLPCREDQSNVLKYELFVKSASSDLNLLNNWERLGAVNALELPMACTLSQFLPGASYHFIVRAVNFAGHNELFSEPCSITIT